MKYIFFALKMHSNRSFQFFSSGATCLTTSGIFETVHSTILPFALQEHRRRGRTVTLRSRSSTHAPFEENRTFSQTGRAQSKSPRLGPKIALRAMKTCSDRDGALCGPTQLREIDQVTARLPHYHEPPGRLPNPARARPRLAQRACGAVLYAARLHAQRARKARLGSSGCKSAPASPGSPFHVCRRIHHVPALHALACRGCSPFSVGSLGFHLVTARCEAGADLFVVIEWCRERNESRWGPQGEKGSHTA